MPPDPFRVIESIVTRKTRSGIVFSENETLTIYDALLSMTIYPAYQIF
jgi:predicted amidohydrolase YtcJ